MTKKSVLQNLLMVGFLSLILPSFYGSTIQAQKKIDEWKVTRLIKSKEHSAQKATLYSAVIPGWGQAYNKKYWKVPIVWAGLGGIAYFINSNSSGYNKYKDYYRYLSENQDSTISLTVNVNPAVLTYGDLGRILDKIESFHKNRDLSIIVLLAWWGLNIVDANVDGHFFNFDIDEDLSFRVSPVIWRVVGNQQAIGLNLRLNLY